VGVLVERVEELPDTTSGAVATCVGETSGDGVTDNGEVDVDGDVEVAGEEVVAAGDVDAGVDIATGVGVAIGVDGTTTCAGGLGVTPVNVVEPFEVPPGPLRTTATVPLIPAGTVVVIVVSDRTVKGAETDPNVTVLTVENPEPVIVTEAPLVFEALPGDMDVIAGTATYTNVPPGVVAELPPLLVTVTVVAPAA
jgi:hypothetical protein